MLEMMVLLVYRVCKQSVLAKQPAVNYTLGTLISFEHIVTDET